MAKVSVIIPLYNQENYIARAIGSVIGQTYQDFELAVVDDGSTDRGPDLVRSFQDPRLKLVQQHNSGPGAARNCGIRESTAPYLAFLDADDEWMPEFLEKYLEVIVANSECEYVVGPRFEGANRTDLSCDWRKSGICEGAWSLPSNVTHVAYHQLLCKLHTVGGMLCSRSVVERYGGFYAKNGCRYGEDRYLEMQLLFNHKLYRLVEPLIWYHTETNGLSGKVDGPKPLHPVLTDPEPVRLSCAPCFRPVLEEWLASHALGYALEYARAGDLSTSRDLIRRFPAMRKNRRKFTWLCCLRIASELRGIASIGRLR